MDNIASSRGYPDAVRLDNGPEFISEALANWAVLHGVKLQFIQPGKPTQNSFIERFNRTFREEVLDFYLFKNLNEIRQISEQWLMQYNEERPHESLGNMSPNQYKLKYSQSVDSTNLWH